MKVPDRWLNYQNGGRINGTRFVAVKVPLKEGFSINIPPSKSFTPQHLRKQYPEIKLVIDLTFTTKYYNGITEFEQHGIKYVKIGCRGRAIPHKKNFKKQVLNLDAGNGDNALKYEELKEAGALLIWFAREVDEFLRKTPNDYLIGIHCTHGVNRTGYLIVRYMIERMGYSPQKALNVFLKSRGHAIERTHYIEDLIKRKKDNK